MLNEAGKEWFGDCTNTFFSCSLAVATALGTIIVVTPYFGIAILPVMYVYFRTMNYFREVSRETKRLDSISRSPVFSHFSETLGGLGTIRSYDQTDRFINEFETKVDANTVAYYNNKTADRWLAIRLELVGSLIAGLAAVFASNVVISNSASGIASSENFASLAGLREAIEAMPELLDGPVAEYGENLSQGQRQLLCLGRSLLKKCRVLLLDEATSSVDYETDSNIQRTLREDFHGCTVLTIAHRVNTIMDDSDKILVMKEGRVGEYAPPEELLMRIRSFWTSSNMHSQSKIDFLHHRC